ncbi:MAG: ATP-binding cassette domain-containing protein [Bryobacterales bacterium]|nr:ATP-binding cassette domain-containing protein [Bryobacterales bacterium]
MIRVQGLTKRYARHVAVDNISFEVQKGQIVGFLGPNGAGKTTTMRVLTCFLPPSEGKAEVAGFDVVEQPLEVKKRIGYLPETPPLYPDMEVEEYLAFVGRLKGIPSASLARRVSEVCERCAVADVRKKLIAKLSKGYRQRVGLAQAIIHNPDVLVLDEPTSGLDPKQIIETRELIRDLAGDHTIILSTHILSEVETSCQQVIIINKGRVVATDSFSNLTNRLRGAEAIAVEFASSVPAAEAAGRFGQIPGVSRVVPREPRHDRHVVEIEMPSGSGVRAEVARLVVNSGWELYEMRSVGFSLEEVFLQLTGSPEQVAPVAAAAEGGAQ